jgi:hypothetical protein
MAIYRNIQMTFWSDAKVVDEFTPEDRYFYLYALTNPHTNLSGCYEISLKQMSDETGYSRETVQKLLQRFNQVHHCLVYGEVTKELLVLHWSRYNWTVSDKFRKPLEKEISGIKNQAFKEYLTQIFRGEEENTVSIPYQYGMDTTVPVPVPVPDTVADNDMDSEPAPSKTKPKEKVERHKYGSYHNVLLSDSEVEKLRLKYPDLEQRIESLSTYMASTGKKYKSHYATIEMWASRETKTVTTTTKTTSKPDYDTTEEYSL